MEGALASLENEKVESLGWPREYLGAARGQSAKKIYTHIHPTLPPFTPVTLAMVEVESWHYKDEDSGIVSGGTRLAPFSLFNSH